jgi:hypothetical protein
MEPLEVGLQCWKIVGRARESKGALILKIFEFIDSVKAVGSYYGPSVLNRGFIRNAIGQLALSRIWSINFRIGIWSCDTSQET